MSSNMITKGQALDAISNACNLKDATNKINNIPTVHTVEIPDNATNGDMIKALFPNIKCKKEGIVVSVKDLDNNKGALFNERHFLADWWNAPYKKEGE